MIFNINQLIFQNFVFSPKYDDFPYEIRVKLSENRYLTLRHTPCNASLKKLNGEVDTLFTTMNNEKTFQARFDDIGVSSLDVCVKNSGVRFGSGSVLEPVIIDYGPFSLQEEAYETKFRK